MINKVRAPESKAPSEVPRDLTGKCASIRSLRWDRTLVTSTEAWASLGDTAGGGGGVPVQARQGPDVLGGPWAARKQGACSSQGAVTPCGEIQRKQPRNQSHSGTCWQPSQMGMSLKSRQF
uniref:Uncharacterized protein n=1 Tax=Pipistrellus kuhlii TaxID=59472 RepID=A0A7J7QTW5_PIPKU|nr:hypothetical protein mPipKuh1_008462 [Pipistrellus kuhlii]